MLPLNNNLLQNNVGLSLLIINTERLTTCPTEWKYSMYISDSMQTTLFYLGGFLEKLADSQSACFYWNSVAVYYCELAYIATEQPQYIQFRWMQLACALPAFLRQLQPSGGMVIGVYQLSINTQLNECQVGE